MNGTGLGGIAEKYAVWWRPTMGRSAIGLMALLAVGLLAVPMPPLALDCLVALNLLIGVFLLAATIDVDSVIQLRAFPSLLLLSTILRLGVNVSTTRAILTTADAGRMVRSFGDFVVGGQIAVGIVVFLIVSIVQFLVVSKGGERIAEVCARFTLDALPGKQTSVDLDLKNGDISNEDARRRRRALEQESQFYGSMDGAMRFVKGDTIAGFLIVCINLAGGLSIGMLQNGLSFSQAAHIYTILSIGDGLAAQIPSILSTLAAGILTTRLTDEAASGGLNADVLAIVRRERRSLGFAAAALGALGLAPGFPHAVLLGSAAVIGATLVFAERRSARQAAIPTPPNAAKTLPPAAFNDPIVVHLHPDTAHKIADLGFTDLLTKYLQASANQTGFSLYPVRFRTDAMLPSETAALLFEGMEVARLPLAIADLGQFAEDIGVRVHGLLPRLITLDDVENWLSQHARVSPKLVELVRTQVPGLTLTHLIRKLIAEDVSLAHPRSMFIELSESVATRFSVEDLLVDARRGLASQIIQRHKGPDGSLAMLTFDQDSENALRRWLAMPKSFQGLVAIDDADKLNIESIRSALAAHRPNYPHLVIVTDELLREPLWQRLSEAGIATSVLSRSEAAHAAHRANVGQVKIEFETSDEEIDSDDFDKFLTDEADGVPGIEYRRQERGIAEPAAERGLQGSLRTESGVKRDIPDPDVHWIRDRRVGGIQ